MTQNSSRQFYCSFSFFFFWGGGGGFRAKRIEGGGEKVLLYFYIEMFLFQEQLFNVLLY